MPSRADEMSKPVHVVATALYGRNGDGPPDDDKKGDPGCASAEGAGLPSNTSINLVDPRPSSGPATTSSSSPAITSSSPATTDNVAMDNES